MKAQTKATRIATTISTLIISASAVLAASTTFAQVDSALPFKKGIGEISQVGNSQKFYSQGVIVADGCYVSASFHGVFGVSKSKNGKIELVPEDQVVAGHTVEFAFDLDEKAGRFRQRVKAEVVEFGTYDDESSEGLLGDRALLKIKDCPSGGYAKGPTFDRTLAEESLPTGKLMTVGTQRKSDGKVEFVVEKDCSAYDRTGATGLVFMTCAAPDGASGRLVLEERSNGNWVYAAMMTAKSKSLNGTKISVGLHSTVVAQMFNRFGDAPAVMMAREPQSKTDRTAMSSAKSLNVVR